MDELKIQYTGKIKEVEIGSGEKKVKVGGENCFNFHNFEGETPNPICIAYEVPDIKPENWPPDCVEPYKDVMDDPVAWCKKCVEEYGANLLTIHLVSADPNGMNSPASEVVKTVERIIKEIDVPLIFWGTDNVEKDAEVLKMVAEVCDGKNVAIGPCVDKNYKQIGAAAIAYKHVVIASSPIDVNLAKQLNILLIELGVPEEKIIIDPTTGGLGYGIEYTYSVMERIRIAGLLQQDDKLAFPMFCFLSKEVWKTKEVTIPESVDPKLGKTKERGVTIEALTATLLLLAGANILVLRHPETASLIKEFIEEMKQ